MYHDMGTNILRISYVTFARGECDSLANNQSRTIADDLLSKYVMEQEDSFSSLHVKLKSVHIVTQLRSKECT